MRRPPLPSWLGLSAFGAAVGVVVGWQLGGWGHPFLPLAYFAVGGVLGGGLAVRHAASRPAVRTLALVLVVGAVASLVTGQVRIRTGTGYAGYHALKGPDGRAVDREPWGTPCPETVIWLTASMPRWVRDEVRATVRQAADAGLKVAVGAEGFSVFREPHVSAEILWDGFSQPVNGNHFRLYRLQVQTTRSAKLSAVSVVMFHKGINHHTYDVRRVVRVLIAATNGIAATSTVQRTGINKVFVLSEDHLSRTDVRVMRSYSGC